MNTITMTAKNTKAPKNVWNVSGMELKTALTKNPKVMAFKVKFGMGAYNVEVNGIVGTVAGVDGFRVKTVARVMNGTAKTNEFRGVKFGDAVMTEGKVDWKAAVRNHFAIVFNVGFKNELTGPVVAEFTKEADRLDFMVRFRDELNRYVAVDGFVARLFGTNRYYVNSVMVAIDWFPTELDTFGKNKREFSKWLRSEGHYTMLGAIRHHCETVCGVAIPDNVGITMPALPTFVRIEATKKVMAIAMSEKFAGTRDEHKKLAKEFAKDMVKRGECFLKKCRDFPRTAPIAMFNFDTNAVLTKWDDLYGVKVVEENDDGVDVEVVA